MVNMYNNFIPKPDTIRAAQKYYSSFERERSLFNFARIVSENSIHTPWRNFACSLRASQAVLLRGLAVTARIFPQYKTAHAAHCHFDLRLRYWTLWTRISAKVIPVWRSCEALAACYRFYLFRNASRNTFGTFPFFRLPHVPYNVQPR